MRRFLTRLKQSAAIAVFIVIASVGVTFAAPTKIFLFGAVPVTLYEARKNSTEIGPFMSSGIGRLFIYTDVTPGTRIQLLGEPGAPTDVEPPALEAVSLGQNYPNPFNPTTRIPFTLGSSERVLVRVFDVRGAHVATIIDETVGAGQHSVEWSGRNDNGQPVASGMYLYTLTAGAQSFSKKMMMLK